METTTKKPRFKPFFLQPRYSTIESFGCGSVNSFGLFQRIAAREQKRRGDQEDKARRLRILGY